jgi:hypothetical protein
MNMELPHTRKTDLAEMAETEQDALAAGGVGCLTTLAHGVVLEQVRLGSLRSSS